MSNFISPWIFTTTNCNLKCPYCYIKQDGQIMTRETYDRVNEVFLNILKSGEKDFVAYRLAGGEPLLMFNNWKDPMDIFLKESSGKGYIAILTNLTYLTNEMIDYFKDRPIGFCVSLDGYSYSKPFANGTSSADTVKMNVDKLLSIGKSIEISTVIDKNSFNDMDKLAEWIAERDLDWGVNIDHFFCGEMDLNVIVAKMFDVLDILNKHNYDIKNKFKFGNISIASSCAGCSAGEKLITVFVNGDIYPCQTTIYKEKICNIFDTNDIIGELKRQNKYKLGYNFTLPEKCQGCPISKICGGGCKENNKEINKNYTCDILKIVVLYIMKLTMNKGDK